MIRTVSMDLGSKAVMTLLSLVLVSSSLLLLTTPYYLLSFLPGIGLLLLVLLLARPQVGFYLLVFLIPFEAYTALLKSHQFFTVSKVVGFSLAVIVLFMLLFQKSIPMSIKSDLWPWLLIYFLLNVVSSIFSDYQLTAYSDLRKLFIAYTFFTLSLMFVHAFAFSRILPALIIVSVTISALFSFFGSIFNLPLFTINIRSESVLRGMGASNDPNYFAGIVIFSLPLVAHLFLASKKVIARLALLLLLAFNVGAIILTYSRGGAIILLLILATIFLEHLNKLRPRHLGFLFLFVVVALASLILFVPSSYWTRQKSVTETKTDISLGRRMSYLVVGAEAFKENPVIGSGPGSFKDVYGATDYARQFTRRGHSPRRVAHNTYLEVLVGNGLPGLIVFLVIIVLGYRSFLSAERNFLERNRTAMASLTKAYRISYIAMLFTFLTLSVTYHKFFWMALALSQTALLLSTTEESQQAPETVGPVL